MTSALKSSPSIATRREIPFGKPIIGDAEREAVMAVMRGSTLTHGPRVKEFEAAFAAFTGAPYALAVSNCTAALHLAYLFAGIGPGDEVIVPAQTHVATAHAVELCGGTCVFLDSEQRTGNIDIDQLESRITNRTKAIAVVHYLGLPVDMTRVLAIAQRRELLVIEDCALSLGATLNGTHTGLYGDIGCFSFYPAKHITTGEGGMIITRRDDLARQAAMQRAFGIDRNVVSDRAAPGQYDVQMLGNNYRMSEMAAAIGVEQMKRLPGILVDRRANFDMLASGLGELDEIQLLQSTGGRCISSCYCLNLLLKHTLRSRRSEIVKYLSSRGIGTSVYYPSPVPAMTYYRQKYAMDARDFPVAAMLSDSGIALPVGPHVSPDDIRFIIASVKDALSVVV